MCGQVLREARVDGEGAAPLRDGIGGASNDRRRDRGEGRKGGPCVPEQGRAQEAAREGPRSDQDGTAPFRRTRTAARRDGTTPATRAAPRATSRVRATTPRGGARITRFGRPATGASETTAWATTIPRAAPRIAPARDSRSAWTSYTPATDRGDAPRLRRIRISGAR